MGQRELFVRRFDMCQFSIEGLLSAHAVDTSAPAADGGPGRFGGLIYIPVNLCVGDFRLVRAAPGTSGTTTVDMYRLRTGVWSLLATLSVSGTSAMTTTNVSMGGQDPLSTFVGGDILMARLRAIESGSPSGLTASVEFR